MVIPEELKTSKEWMAQIYPQYEIQDPDGWDRMNFAYSYEEELIDQYEFYRRFSHSTITTKDPWTKKKSSTTSNVAFSTSTESTRTSIGPG